MTKGFKISKKLKKEIWNNLDPYIKNKYSEEFFFEEFLALLRAYKCNMYSYNVPNLELFSNKGGLRGFFARSLSKHIVFENTSISCSIYKSIYKEFKKNLKKIKGNKISFVKYADMKLTKDGRIILKLNKDFNIK